MAQTKDKQEAQAKAQAADANEPFVKEDGAKTGSQAADPITGLPSAMAASGEVVSVPVTPEEIARQGTELGQAGDVSTGGNVEPVGDPRQSKSRRIWGMDNDHTVDNRADADPLKPDAAEVNE